MFKGKRPSILEAPKVRKICLLIHMSTHEGGVVG